MNILSGYEWATHQPLIRAVMDLYKPQFILELGAGDYSTPLFLEFPIPFISVDTDKEWVERLNKKYEVNIIYQEIPEKEFDDLTTEEITQISEFYKNISIPDLRPNLLFVDQHHLCRTISINSLRDKFDLIIYHDSEAWKINHYDLINTSGFSLSELKTNGPSTMLMAREPMDINTVIGPYIEKFKNEYPKCLQMYVDTR